MQGVATTTASTPVKNEPVAPLRGHTESVWNAIFSPDGRRVVTASADQTLRTWNSTSGDLVAELYDPTSGTFSDTGSTTTLRTGHTATLLTSGQVLIAGGGTATAELYNPTSGTFTATAGDMTEPRSGHTATLLGAADCVQNGYVLIIGTDGFGTDRSAELYDPSTQTFARVGSLPALTGFSGWRNTASLRNDGTVLAAGGSTETRCGRFGGFGPVSRNGGALFAPESDGFTVTGLIWVAQFAVGLLLLPFVWSSDDHRGDLTPWWPWTRGRRRR